jgi:hypothetical protein
LTRHLRRSLAFLPEFPHCSTVRFLIPFGRHLCVVIQTCHQPKPGSFSIDMSVPLPVCPRQSRDEISRAASALYQLFFNSSLPSTRQRKTHRRMGFVQVAPKRTARGLASHRPLAVFQHLPVRTSTNCYIRFILPMVRSPVFGSGALD